MLTLNDGRSELWQWDTKRKLTVDADCSQVHFSNKVFGRSIDVDVIDGVAIIPDILLQTDKDLNVWAFVGTAENGYTKISKTFKVNRRNKPSDYVFTPPEQTSLEEIKKEIEYLKSIQDPDAIKNAVDEYLANNPIQIDEKDPTVPDWAKQPVKPKYTAKEVGAVATINGIEPDENGNVVIANISTVEPAEDDIPKVFFGGALQQTKTEAVVPFRYISKTQDISGYAEIKAQGNSSMSYPKKNQTVKLFKDAGCTEKLKVDFKGWGKQNKHVYKANWIDLSHARNVVSARLWADIVKSRANYAELPELLRTSPNQGAVDGFPVKVFAAGVYQGRYTLNIPKDKWTFNMDDDLNEHCVLCGENYASGCFRASAQINESDWTDEIHDTVPASIKTRWNEVISFVMNSTDEDFRANLGNYFYIDSLIDYYLFGLASCGLDAFGKNQIYMTYDGQRWIASMYDMDSTWGLYWNGSKFVATDYARTSYEDFASTASSGDGNLLYIRLEQLFWSELQTRWAELKNGALSIENIINRFERFTDIAPAELVKEDFASTTGGGKFTGIPSQSTNNIQQIRSFALERQAWTDEYVSSLTGGGEEEPDTPEPSEVPCTSISLDKSELTFDGEGTQTITATVTPTDTTDRIVWISDNTAIATVENGVVTPVADGLAVITATCGNQIATCTVTVSGVKTVLIWTDTPTYDIDKTTGEQISGNRYVSNIFNIEKGYRYRFEGSAGNGIWGALAVYNNDGTLASFSENNGKGRYNYVDVFEDGTIDKARLAINPNNGAVNLTECVLENDGFMSSPAYKINKTTGAVETGQNAVSLKMFAVVGGAKYSVRNVNGGTATWKGVCEYAEDGTFIKFSEGGSTTDAYELTLDANTAFVRLSVYTGSPANYCAKDSLELVKVE